MIISSEEWDLLTNYYTYDHVIVVYVNVSGDGHKTIGSLPGKFALSLHLIVILKDDTLLFILKEYFKNY